MLNKTAYILNIETATKNCSITLAKNGMPMVSKELAEEQYTHAEKLHVFIAEALAELHITARDLTAVAVSQGPGSYTGLRIGVAAAKGFCFALDIPLITVDTLTILATQAQQQEGYIIPMIDARRMEVFYAIFNAQLQKINPTQTMVITQDSFSEMGSHAPIYLVGDGAAKCKPLLHKKHFIFIDTVLYPSSKAMCKISYEKLLKHETVDLPSFEPHYAKEFMS